MRAHGTVGGLCSHSYMEQSPIVLASLCPHLLLGAPSPPICPLLPLKPPRDSHEILGTQDLSV